MFKEWKYSTVFSLELMIPWFVPVSGVPAIYWFFESGRAYREQYDGSRYKVASGLFDAFYGTAMVTGWVAVALELVIGIAAFVMLIYALVKKPKERYCVCRPLTLWGCSVPCVFGTLELMFWVHAFTYGMGV